MKVIVKESLQEQFIGFFDHIRRRTGDVFVIPDTPRRGLFPAEKKLVDGNDEARAVYEQIKDSDGNVPLQFSFRWMEPVAASKAESTSTAQQSLDRKSEIIKKEKAGAREIALGGGKEADVL